MVMVLVVVASLPHRSVAVNVTVIAVAQPEAGNEAGL